jgi:signal transduction histidine kinase
MELNKTSKWFYISTGVVSAFILLLGSWWLYLVFKLAEKLNQESIPNLDGNLISMVKWEGFTFFVLLVALTAALAYFFYQDHKKTKALQSFFASLTHELKTPLASIRLQSQVMNEFIEDLDISNEKKELIQKYSSRLLQDTSKLEDQLDKHLQLSKLERDHYLEFQDIELSHFISSEYRKFNLPSPETSHLKNYFIHASPFTLSMIFKNLIENSIRHNQSDFHTTIELKEIKNKYSLSYNDHGKEFTGDIRRLGQLFYKHNSPKGSGIGLYLIRKLMLKNMGTFSVEKSHNLIFHLTFLKGKE